MDSLARLRTDHVDLYFLHRDDPSLPVGPIVEALNEHRNAGRIRAFGGSNWTYGRIAEANAYAAAHGLAPFVASSPNFGLAEQVENPWGEGCTSLSGPTNATDREWHRKNRIAVFAYSSLGRGFFSGRLNRENYREVADGACLRAYCHEVNFQRLDRVRELAGKKGCSIAQLALAWTLAQPLEIHALVGAASQEEIEQNRAALDITLTETELAWLDLRDSR
jgi:aryl-alcohol dehydrogenase-like predicted oxidoreductase